MLVVLQALVGGLASARAAALLASPFDAAVICHGAGSEPPAGGAPASGGTRELCCAFCAAAAPLLLSVTPPVVGLVQHAGTDQLATPARDPVLIARRAVRAGPSQAPPRFA
jgi:hypothetical protein